MEQDADFNRKAAAIDKMTSSVISISSSEADSSHEEEREDEDERNDFKTRAKL